MTTASIWMNDSERTRFPALDRDLEVDVAIIGGGITGATAALLLTQAGKRVALLERDRAGQVDTGHTTAHLTVATDLRLSDLVDQFGENDAQAVWDAGQSALDAVSSLVESRGIDCDFQWVPGYLHSPLVDPPEHEAERLEDDARLARKLGFDAVYTNSVPLIHRPGILFPNQARFHPLKYVSALLHAVHDVGGHVFENSEVTEFRDAPRAVVANGHRVRCEYVVVATHVPLMGLAGLVGATLLQTKIYPYSTYAVSTRVPHGGIPDALFWDTADPYQYVRLHPRDGYDELILGGEDHKTGQEPDPAHRFRRLERSLQRLVPGAEPTGRWSGQVIETNDGLPYFGETAERQFVATGYSDNGMTFGTLGGILAADAALGRRNPWSELFSVQRTKLRGGTWDYLKENVDYPYYYLKDRLAAAQGESLDSLRPGEGRLLKIEGERVAAWRSPDGEVRLLSPYCTHMGCLVHWNDAESSWDCPCHGSRFDTDGAVIGGPAETALPEVDPARKH